MAEAEEVLSCPLCGTTKYSKPNMRMMVSTCGHELCDTCHKSQFVAGRSSIVCPGRGCGFTLHPQDFEAKVFASGLVHKEMVVRKKYLRDFVLTERDFGGDLQAYNDYLEMVEELCFNLVHEIDVKETRRRIEVYVEENKARFANAAQNRRRELEETRAAISEEERRAVERRAQVSRERDQSKATAAQRHETLLGQIAVGAQFPTGGEEEETSAMDTSIAHTARKLVSQTPLNMDISPMPAAFPLFRYAPPPLHAHSPSLVPPTPALRDRTTTYAVFSLDPLVLRGAGVDPSLFMRKALHEAQACLFH